MLDFGQCPVNELSFQTLQIRNNGELDFTYNWSVPGPFKIEPETGNLAIGNSATFTVTFSPKVSDTLFIQLTIMQAAGVWESSAVITVQRERTLDKSVMKFRASGKYPFLSLSDTELQFKEVVVGKTVERILALSNPSLVCVKKPP